MFVRFVAILLLISFHALLVPFAKADEEVKFFFYLHDHLGGIEKVLNEDLEVVADRDYLPFGMELETAKVKFSEVYGEVGPAQGVGDNYGFTGKELDAETELYYYGVRYYDPLTGRFGSIDPLVLDEALYSEQGLMQILLNPQMLNGYAYVINNPMVLIDLWGEQAEQHLAGMGRMIDGGVKLVGGFANVYLNKTPTGKAGYPAMLKGSEDLMAGFMMAGSGEEVDAPKENEVVLGVVTTTATLGLNKVNKEAAKEILEFDFFESSLRFVGKKVDEVSQKFRETKVAEKIRNTIHNNSDNKGDKEEN